MNRQRIFATPFILVTLVSCTAVKENLDDTNVLKGDNRGNEIVAEYLKRDSAPFRKTKVRLSVAESGRPTKQYVLESWRRQKDGETRTLTHALEPEEERDLASLTFEKPEVPAVNVSYVASQKRFRESGTGKIFFGGLTSQELLGEWRKYGSKFLSEKEIDGKKMLEVESKLLGGRKSVITRILTLFDSASYLPRELRLFNSDGRQLRTFKITETKTLDGREVVAKTIIANHIHKTTVTIKLLDISFPKVIPEEVFEREYLKQFAK